MVGKYLREKATGLKWPAHTASAAAISNLHSASFFA
jgi:hypothetical protein